MLYTRRIRRRESHQVDLHHQGLVKAAREALPLAVGTRLRQRGFVLARVDVVDRRADVRLRCRG